MTDIIIPKKNVIFDATVMSSLMGCPRKADLQFNHNLTSINGKSNSLEVGSVVHKFLEVYYGSIIKGLNKSMAAGHGFAAAELYVAGCPHCTDFTSIEGSKPICGHKANDYPGIVNTPKESEGYLIGWHYALDTCQQYLDFYKNDHWVPLEVETVKARIIYEDADLRVMWKSKLDWVVDTNQGIYPVDHKTMKQNRKSSNLNNQFMGQCLMMNTRNVFINKIGFQKTLSAAEKFMRPPISYSASRLLEFQSETIPYYANFLLMYTEGEHFPPNYTHCESKYGDCTFMKVCEADSAMREEEIKIYFKVGPEWNPTNEGDE